VKRVSGPRAWAGLTYGAVLAVLVIAGGATFWYRATYNVMPGQNASARVHWCGRDYGSSGSPTQTWQQISAQQRSPLHAVGDYPPLGLGEQELFAAASPAAQRSSVSPSPPCAMVVYLRTGSNQYVAYPLEGGP
jgi:hypothetical protein